MAEGVVVHDEEERLRRRRRLTILLVPIVFFYISSTIMGFLSPALIKDHPLWVITFNPINRYLILASNHVETWEFFLVGFTRLVLTDPLYFLLGYWFGDGALDWIEEKTGGSGMVPFIKKWFGRAGPVIVLLAPNAYVCLLAGAAGMKLRLFVALNVLGTIGRLVLIQILGERLEDYIDPVLDFVNRYQWWFVIGSIALFVLQQGLNKAQGKDGGEEVSVTKMADELEASIAKREAAETAAEVPAADVTAATKPAAKKPAAKKTATKKTATKKPAAKQPAAKKSAPAKKAPTARKSTKAT